jgi:hypothetical protein
MKTSAAIRVNAILQSALKNSDNISSQAAFAKILGIESLDGHDVQDAVSDALGELRAEIRRVETVLKEKETPQPLIDIPIQAALSLTSPLHIAGAWMQNRAQQLRSEVLVAWGWVAFFLPSIEDDVTEEALHDLERELNEMEEAATAEGVPSNLRAFIVRQGAKIRKALRRYQVEGVEPLKEAISTGMGDLIRAAPTMKPIDASNPASANAFGRLSKAWTNVAKMAGESKAIYDAYQLVAPAIPAIQSYIAEGAKLLSDSLIMVVGRAVRVLRARDRL